MRIMRLKTRLKMIAITVNWLLKDWLLVLVAVLSMVTGWCSCWAARWLWNLLWQRGGGLSTDSNSTPSPPPQDSDSLQKILKKIEEMEKVIKRSSKATETATRDQREDKEKVERGGTVVTHLTINGMCSPNVL